LLKDEFPDVTISKIRFLESQGLLDPERTPSGYRKFYDTDVERLRWILRQQREHFLPLKVIKGRLRGTSDDGEGANGSESDDGGSSSILSKPGPDPLATSPTGTSMTIEELSGATGLDVEDLHELERYGFISGRSVASAIYYDEEALVVANLAVGFMKFGVEARHLRMYKTAAEREASFLEQVVMPMLKQRNPRARRQAAETLSDLARLGQGLRAAMLRQGLRSHLDGN